MNIIGKRVILTNPENNGIIVDGPLVLRDAVFYVVLFDNGNLGIKNASDITIYHYNRKPDFD